MLSDGEGGRGGIEMDDSAFQHFAVHTVDEEGYI